MTSDTVVDCRFMKNWLLLVPMLLSRELGVY